MTKRIHVGTSGWHYAHWKGRFYPADLRESDRLGYYAKHFDIVELNNTFYRLPTEGVVLRWRDTSPLNFRFAVKVDEVRLLTFLQVLPQGNRYAFEFRNPSWNIEPVYKVLARFRAGYCIFDLAGFQSPFELTTEFTYVRLHGPGAKYRGSYEESNLRSWARRLRKWDLNEAYVFFDNDQVVYAIENARRLQSLIDS